MSQPIVTERTVTLTAAGGATPTARVWAAPCSYAFRDIAIWVTSRGQVPAAGNLDWEVFYGGVWEGTAFDTGSTHTGGASQGSGSIAGGAEIAEVIYEDGSILPPNARIVRPTPSGTDMGLNGFPVVVEFENKKVAAVTFGVTFIARTLSDPV